MHGNYTMAYEDYKSFVSNIEELHSDNDIEFAWLPNASVILNNPYPLKHIHPSSRKTPKISVSGICQLLSYSVLIIIARLP